MSIMNNGNKKRKISLIIIAIILTTISYFGYDIFYAPQNISFEEKNIKMDNILVKKVAEDLIIQQYIEGEGLYASNGYDIYYLEENGNNKFKKIGRLSVPLGISYFGNSDVARYLLNQEEVLEMIRLDSGTLLAFAGGYIFRGEKNEQQDYSFEITGDVEHFGIGAGRGVMPQGYAEDSSGAVYWGEYWDNPDRKPVRIYKSTDDGQSWKVAYEFSSGEIRHIHAVQYDPYSDSIWIATGDRDDECKIGYLDDKNNFVSIGKGSQKWRAVSLVFTEEWIYWGMDGTSETYPNPKIWRYHREKERTELIKKIDSLAFYSAVSNSKKIITTDGKGGDGASLWLTADGEFWFEGANFPRAREGHFGTIRVLAGPYGGFYLTKHNLEGFNNCAMLITVD